MSSEEISSLQKQTSKSSRETKGRHRRRQKRDREEDLGAQHVHQTGPRKRLKATTCTSVFDSHMMDDTFLLLLRFFVSDSGLVDGKSIRNIMLVSKRWYRVATSTELWAAPSLANNGNVTLHRVPQRPSPWIRDACPSSAKNFPNLVGFANLGKRITNDGRTSYTARERATGKLFIVNVLDSEDHDVIRSAASAHHLQGDSFLEHKDEKSPFFVPVGMESSSGNRKVVIWYEHVKSFDEWYQNTEIGDSGSPLQIEFLKNMLRQILVAASRIHRTGAVHGCIGTTSLYVSSTDLQIPCFKLVCSSLFPIVAPFTPSTQCLQYTSPELLFPLSKGLETVPTPEADIWSIGCVMAQMFRHGLLLFGNYPTDWENDGRTNSVETYARQVCRMVGLPPSCSAVMTSLQSDEFPLDSKEILQKELSALDENGLDLMAKLLSPDPTKRPTADEALAHPFLSEMRITRSVHRVVSRPQDYDLRRISLLASREQMESPTRRHARNDAWSTLVDYTIEITEVFDLNVASAFRAMNYFDRFFSSYPGSGSFTSRRCQLVVATCLYITTKCDEVELTKGDLTFSADNTFDRNDMSIAEEVILHELKWKLSFPTILDFVELLCNAIRLEEGSKLRFMAYYIAELALQCQVYLTYKPSLIASCVVVLGLSSIGSLQPWPVVLSEATGYSWNDLEECMLALTSGIHQVRTTMPELKIITRKYRKTENGNVAYVTIPRITTFTALTNARRENR